MNIKLDVDKSDEMIRGCWEMFVALERRAIRQMLYCPRPLHKKYRRRIKAIFDAMDEQSESVAAA